MLLTLMGTCSYTHDMETQRTITILLPNDPDLRATLLAFQRVQQQVSPLCFNDGQPVRAVPLQRACYHQVKGTLNSQMTITALRLVAGAYASARSNKRPATRPFRFGRPAAVFLVGVRGRDADFRKDGSLSIWTVAGRKRISYIVPAHCGALLAAAKEIDSLTVIIRGGKLLGRVVLTLEAPEPAGSVPVGIDLNETNALVAVDAEGRTLFLSGKATKVANKRTSQTMARLQGKKATKKAEASGTRSVRRVLKRLSRRRSNRTRTFAHTAAKRLVQWAPRDAILVFEDLHLSPPQRGAIHGRPLRRRLSLWQRGLIRRFSEQKAALAGLAVTAVDPAYTSKTCSRCGLRGVRKRHTFTCPSCGFAEHADRNAAINIRMRFVQSRLDGERSTSPEARSPGRRASRPPVGDGR